MQEIYIRKTYKLFSECTEEEKKKFIKIYSDDEIFYINRRELYEMETEDLFYVTNEKSQMLSVDRNKLWWESNSQGWYYERNSDFLHGDFSLNKGIYTCSMNYVSLKNLHSIKDFIEMTDFTVTDRKGNTDISFSEIKNKRIQKFFFKKIKMLYAETTKFIDRLNSIISDYVQYYPTEEEIIAYLIDNEIEFQTKEEVIKRIA